MALDTDLSDIQDRVFYISGGYKYAMSGEGCCFIHVPDGYAQRPRNTGWYAEFGALGNDKSGDVRYGSDAMRFWGATFDPSGLYRMNSVLQKLASENIGIHDIHNHVVNLQSYFLKKLGMLESSMLNEDMLVIHDQNNRGHFLTFETKDASALQHSMEQQNIITDHRGHRLRFGFGIYQDNDMIDELMKRLSNILAVK